MAKRKPEDYPRQLDEYPEIMSKMDPLIIRVSPTVLLVGSTTYTAKIKLGYRFNGFHVNVTGVGIPIYTEEVNIENASTTNKSTVNGMSDAYNKVEERATTWMDDLEKSMIDDSKEKNVVDLLREIKYQMHFDASGHKYPAITPGTEQYDERMEVCTEIPTYIEDLYTMLLQITIRLDNLTSVINGGSLKKLREDSVEYNQETGKFDYHEDNVGEPVKGLNERIDDLNESIGTSKDGVQGGKSLQSRITDIQESIGNGTDADHTSLQDMIYNNTLQLTAIQSSIGPGTGSGQGGASLQAKIDAVAADIVALSTQSGTNATTISNAITNGLNQLVAQMNTMNGKIGMPNDSWQSNTLFGKIDITNTRIGNPTEGGGPDITSRLSTISTNVSTVSTNVSGLPTFINNYSSTLSHLNSALHEGNCGANYEWQSDRGFSSISGPGWGISVHVSN